MQTAPFAAASQGGPRADSAHSRTSRSRVALPFLLLALLPGGLYAQSTGSAPKAEDTSALILAPPAAAPAAATRPPAGSPALALDVSAVMPSYRPDPPAAGTYPAGVDLRTVDKPRNQIPRLPVEMMQRYVVRESKEPVFRTRDLLSKVGLIDLAFKEHPGLRFGNIFNLNAPAAYDRAIREQLAASRSDLADDTFAMAAGGDPGEEAVMQQDIIDASFSAQSPVFK